MGDTFTTCDSVDVNMQDTIHKSSQLSSVGGIEKLHSVKHRQSAPTSTTY